MKAAASVSICVLLLLAAVPAALAQNSGPSANGTFQFSSGNQPLSIAFNARTHGNGRTSGEMTLTGSAEVPDQDVDGEGGGAAAEVVAVSLTMDVDCLKIDGNRAALSGVVTQASVGAFVGRRGLLSVEDNGEGSKSGAPDRFMWGLYRTPSLTWVATDGELEFDPGAGLTWHATDFERDDDAGIPSHKSASVDCQTFPVSSYTFEDLAHGNGNIQVKP